MPVDSFPRPSTQTGTRNRPDFGTGARARIGKQTGRNQAVALVGRGDGEPEWEPHDPPAGERRNAEFTGLDFYTSRYRMMQPETITMLSKTAEYALRTIVWLARYPADTEPAERLAQGTRVPRRYLHKVLQDLVRAKLVRSQSGPGGGYALARSPETITILDVVNSVAPVERIRKCPLGLRSHTTLCPLHEELDRVYAATEKAFSRVVIGHLLRSTNRVVPLREVKG